LDQDNRTDLITASDGCVDLSSPEPQKVCVTVRWHRQEGDGTFTPFVIGEVGGQDKDRGANELALDDVDADGMLDVLLLADKLYVLRRSGTNFVQSEISSRQSYCTSLATGSMRLPIDKTSVDVLMLCDSELVLVPLSKQGQDAGSSRIIGEGLSEATELAVEDLNGDGLMDAVVVTPRRALFYANVQGFLQADKNRFLVGHGADASGRRAMGFTSS